MWINNYLDAIRRQTSALKYYTSDQKESLGNRLKTKKSVLF